MPRHRRWHRRREKALATADDEPELGDVLIELGDAADICDLPLPAGMSVTWLLRSEGQDLWQALMALPPRRGEGVFAWVAAEPELMRKAKKMFHNKWDLPATQGSFSAFWVG